MTMKKANKLLFIASVMCLFGCASHMQDANYVMTVYSANGEQIFYIGKDWIVQCDVNPTEKDGVKDWRCIDWVRKGQL
jgi:hypothetical protein